MIFKFFFYLMRDLFIKYLKSIICVIFIIILFYIYLTNFIYNRITNIINFNNKIWNINYCNILFQSCFGFTFFLDLLLLVVIVLFELSSYLLIISVSLIMDSLIICSYNKCVFFSS